MPEELPTPKKSLKQLEKENKKFLKKIQWYMMCCFSLFTNIIYIYLFFINNFNVNFY